MPLKRGDATRNSTGTSSNVTKRQPIKLVRTASDTRRCQDVEMPLRGQSRAQQSRGIRPVVNISGKKDDRLSSQPPSSQQQQQQQRDNNNSSGVMRPLTDIMQKTTPISSTNHSKVYQI